MELSERVKLAKELNQDIQNEIKEYKSSISNYKEVMIYHVKQIIEGYNKDNDFNYIKEEIKHCLFMIDDRSKAIKEHEELLININDC